MTLVIPPGYAQAAFRFSLTGDPEVMVTTVGVNMDSFSGTAVESAEALAAHWLDAFGAAGYPSTWQFRGVVLRVGQDGGPPVIAEAPRNVAGTASLNCLPNNCAILVRKQSDLGGRAGRGRFYLPPCYLSEANVNNNGVIDSAGLPNLQTAMDDVFTGFNWVILHDDVGPPIVPTPITGFSVQSQIATQRRRMRP